jgi:hypothetical protein
VVGSQGFPVPGNADVALPGNLPQAGLAAVQLADGKLAAIFEKKSGFDWNLEGRLLADVEGGAWTFASTLSLPADANALETSPHVVVSGDNVFLAWLDEDPQVVRGCVRRYDAAFANPSADGCAEPEGAGIVAVALASLHDGRAVLAWQDSGVPDHTVNVAVVDGSGNLGEAVAVDVDEMDSTGALGVAGFAGGKAVITWTRSAPGTGLDVWAKFLQLD